MRNSNTIKKLLKNGEEIWEKPYYYERKNYLSLKGSGAPLVKLLASTPLHTEYGDWTYMVFGDYTTGSEQTMLVYGRYSKKEVKGKRLLLRVHSECDTSELFHATNCECRQELNKAMEEIRKNGSGIIIYLKQEGAGNGLLNKTKAYNMAFSWKGDKVVESIEKKTRKPVSVYDAYLKLGLKSENRSFSVAAAMLKSVGVSKVTLMTNNPNKVNGLRSEGIDTEPMGLHIKPENNIMRHHLKAKATQLGHAISKEDL